jgi:NAD(P)H-hydrate epimerase
MKICGKIVTVTWPGRTTSGQPAVRADNGGMLTLTREQVREIDRLAIEELGIPGIVLMENAARSVAEVALDVLELQLQLTPSDARVAVLCGGGNNGGDGYAIARHLHNAGVAVTIDAATPPEAMKGDALVNASVCGRMGLPMRELRDLATIEAAAVEWGRQRLLIDALLGTGFQGVVREPMDVAIARCNEARHRQGVFVLAVDVPSGLDCNTGHPSNATIEAGMTVTFVAAKRGFVTEAARPYVGELAVVEIGTPPQLVARVVGGGAV